VNKEEYGSALKVGGVAVGAIPRAAGQARLSAPSWLAGLTPGVVAGDMVALRPH